MPIDFLEKNLEVLKKNDPKLAEKLTNLAVPGDLKVESSATGEPTACWAQSDTQSCRLHSRRNPVQESQQWAARLSFERGKNVVLLGPGLGYPLLALLDQHRQNIGHLWILEASLEVFRAMLSYRDWRWLLNEPTIHFFVAEDETQLRRQLSSSFQSMIVNGVEIVEFNPATRIFADWYRSRQKNFLDLVRQWTCEMTTVMERGPLFQANTLKNLKNLPDCYLLRDLGPVFTNRPAIMVSAGPSLNRNVQQLAQAKGKIPIIAVDTTLRVLHNHGIQPDLVVSIDALGMSVRHFEGVEGLSEIPLVFDLEVTPEVRLNYPGPCFLIGNNKPQIYSWLEETTGKLENLNKGLTVAQAAFLMLAAYGVDPIILVGQDLSFEPDGGGTHAEGVAFQGRFEPSTNRTGRWEDPLKPEGLQDINVIWVPGNQAREVPTTHTLYTYLKRLEDDIAQTGVNVINATEGGACIRGTKSMSLTEAYQIVEIEQLTPFESFQQTQSLQTLGEQFGAQLESLYQNIQKLLDEGQQHCQEGLRVCDKLYRDLGWKNLSVDEVEKKFQPILEAFSFIRNNNHFQMLIDRGVMRSLYMLHKGDIPPPEQRSSQDNQRIVERYRNFFLEALAMIERDRDALT